MTNPFDGIDEKLIRSNENIRNLSVEITDFFGRTKYPVLPHSDKKLLLEAIEYHKSLEIPLRFSVLAGEIIHHLRSCLDHVVWVFSDPAVRVKHVRTIQFPILETRPSDKQSIANYEGKIIGVTKAEVRDGIERLQPYNASNPLDSPLLIIHKMDILDKHRELLICYSNGSFEFPPDMEDKFATYQSLHPDISSAELAYHFKDYGKVVPQVSFGDFGRRETQPVIEGLIELHNHVVSAIKTFSSMV